MGKKSKKNLEVDETQSEEYIAANKGDQATTTDAGNIAPNLTKEELEELEGESTSSSRLFTMTKFIKKLSIGTDLTHSSLPGSFILPRSTLSYFSENYSGQFDILLKANKIDDQLERFLEVYRYLVSTCHVIVDTTRKPLNPILGETYQARVESEESKNSYFFAEQISHHPPISCSMVYNKEAGVKVTYQSPVKSSFMGTYVKITMDGDTKLILDKHGEVYNNTTPYMAIRIFRNFSEYIGTTKLTCNKSEYRAKTTFYPKPLLFGNYNEMEATIYKGKEKLYKIKGQWHTEMKITNLKTGESKPFFKYTEDKNKIVIPAKEELLPTDSSNVWKGVFDASANGQVKDMTKEKTKVEEEQRKLAAERKEKKTEWKPLHFHKESNTDDSIWVLNEYKN